MRTTPVGLQCYAIESDPRDHLKQSMNVWNELNRRLGAEEGEKD